MVSTVKTGCYLIGGTQLIEDDAQAEAIIAAKTGRQVSREDAKKETISYGILQAHNTSGNMENLQIKFDKLTSHVHFRDPGQTYKEDILTGAVAAAKGGYTSVVMMGNTSPHMDNADTLAYATEKGKRTGIHCYACGNITMGMEGKVMTDFEELVQAGAVLFTDDGKPVLSPELMQQACIKSAAMHKVLSLHVPDGYGQHP